PRAGVRDVSRNAASALSGGSQRHAALRAYAGIQGARKAVSRVQGSESVAAETAVGGGGPEGLPAPHLIEREGKAVAAFRQLAVDRRQSVVDVLLVNGNVQGGDAGAAGIACGAIGESRRGRLDRNPRPQAGICNGRRKVVT